MTQLASSPAPVEPVAQKPLLEVKNLVTYFGIKGGLMQRVVAHVKAVDDVSFTVQPEETLGLIGESGSGKSTIARTILRLIPATSGQVYIDGRSVFDAGGEELKRMRRDMQVIFQDPYSSLDPRMRVGTTIAESLAHRLPSARAGLIKAGYYDPVRGLPPTDLKIGNTVTVVGYPNRGRPEEMRAERITIEGKTFELR